MPIAARHRDSAPVDSARQLGLHSAPIAAHDSERVATDPVWVKLPVDPAPSLWLCLPSPRMTRSAWPPIRYVSRWIEPRPCGFASQARPFLRLIPLKRACGSNGQSVGMPAPPAAQGASVALHETEAMEAIVVWPYEPRPLGFRADEHLSNPRPVCFCALKDHVACSERHNAQAVESDRSQDDVQQHSCRPVGRAGGSGGPATAETGGRSLVVTKCRELVRCSIDGGGTCALSDTDRGHCGAS